MAFSLGDPASAKAQLSGGPAAFVDRAAGRLQAVTGVVFLPVSPEKAWSVITDYGQHAAWLPQVKEATVVASGATATDVAYILDFQFSVVSKEVEYTLRYTPDTVQRKLAFTLVSGDFARTEGAWKVDAAPGGCIVSYRTWTDLASMGWLVEAVLEDQPELELAIQVSTAISVVEALERRVKGA